MHVPNMGISIFSVVDLLLSTVFVSNTVSLMLYQNVKKVYCVESKATHGHAYGIPSSRSLKVGRDAPLFPSRASLFAHILQSRYLLSGHGFLGPPL